MWSGIGVSTLCGSVSTIKYIQAYTFSKNASSTDLYPIFDENRTKYNDVSQNYAFWATATLTGLTATGVGLYLYF
jgi:hypothetical protein